MASGALFGGSSGRSQSKNLVEFRAGKMFMKGKMVHPDKRKGTVYLNQSEDNLMHFCWKDRTTGTTEDVIFLLLSPMTEKFVWLMLALHSAVNMVTLSIMGMTRLMLAYPHCTCTARRDTVF